MNLFKVKIIELRNAAEVLLMKLLFTEIYEDKEFREEFVPEIPGSWLFFSSLDARFLSETGEFKSGLKELGGIGSNRLLHTTKRNKLKPEVNAICNILRAHLTNTADNTGLPENLLDEDVELIRKCLNTKITRVLPALFSEPNTKGPWCLMPETSTIRYAAEALIQYLQYFTNTPDLADYEPLAECQYCKSIFLIQKRGQKFCLDECRQQQWYADKGKEYYSPDQRKKRQKIRERRNKSVKRSSRRS